MVVEFLIRNERRSSVVSFAACLLRSRLRHRGLYPRPSACGLGFVPLAWLWIGPRLIFQLQPG
jgi:hypothetical protein